MQYQFQKIQYCTCVYICITKNPVSICRTAFWPYENNVHVYAYMYIHAYTNSMPYNDTYVIIIMYTYIIALFLKKLVVLNGLYSDNLTISVTGIY